MALALLDTLTPWRRDRLGALPRRPGGAHTYMIHVGAGWILARLPLSPERLLCPRSTRCSAGWPSTATASTRGTSTGRGRSAPGGAAASSAAMPAGAFDQGLGRSLWFVEGADVRRAAADDRRLPRQRASRTCGPASGSPAPTPGGADARRARGAAAGGRGARAASSPRAPPSRPRRASGPATSAAHTELACEVICGPSAAEAPPR